MPFIHFSNLSDGGMLLFGDLCEPCEQPGLPWECGDSIIKGLLMELVMDGM